VSVGVMAGTGVVVVWHLAFEMDVLYLDERLCCLAGEGKGAFGHCGCGNVRSWRINCLRRLTCKREPAITFRPRIPNPSPLTSAKPLQPKRLAIERG
jgi:hypothetical protein